MMKKKLFLANGWAKKVFCGTRDKENFPPSQHATWLCWLGYARRSPPSQHATWPCWLGYARRSPPSQHATWPCWLCYARRGSPSSTPSSSPSPPPDPSSSPSLPTLPFPTAWSTFVNCPPPPTVVRALSLLGLDILRWARSHTHFFLGWTNHLTADLAIPHLVFYSFGAFAVSIINYLWPRMPRREDGDSPAALTVLSELPSSSVFPFDHLPGIWRRFSAGEPDSEFMREGFLANATDSWGAAINTFNALEVPFLAHLRRIYRRVWAVGPMSPAGPVAGQGGRSSIPAGELAAWLDACPPRSVVYVCFESQFTPTEKQGRAPVAALERSGVRFVWAAGGGGALVPEGFEQRVAGWGLMVRGWAPQVESCWWRSWEWR